MAQSRFGPCSPVSRLPGQCRPTIVTGTRAVARREAQDSIQLPDPQPSPIDSGGEARKETSEKMGAHSSDLPWIRTLCGTYFRIPSFRIPSAAMISWYLLRLSRFS